MNKSLILVVDDEPDICGLISMYISKKGFQVLTAANGEDALKLFRIQKPAIVITDFRMPGMDGIELLKAVKAINKNVQVIMISGHADMKTAVRAIKEDAIDFINKPIDIKELWETVISAVNRTDNREEKNRLIKTGVVSHEIFEAAIPVSGLFLNIPLDDYNKSLILKRIRSFHDQSIIQSRIVLVLRNVEYINNVGLNLLIDLVNDLKGKKHKIILSQLSDPVISYLKNLGYLDYFRIEQSLDDALEKIRRD